MAEEAWWVLELCVAVVLDGVVCRNIILNRYVLWFIKNLKQQAISSPNIELMPTLPDPIIALNSSNT